MKTLKMTYLILAMLLPGTSLFSNAVRVERGSALESPTIDTRFKIRLGIKGPSNFNREILLTFDERASDAYDRGFDVHLSNDFPNDVYWMLDNNKLVIQATDKMYNHRVFPIGITSDGNGPISIGVNMLENPPPYVEVYLRDNETMETYSIMDASFEVDLEAGEYNEQYALVFEAKKETSDTVAVSFEESIEKMYKNTRIFFNNSDGEVWIKKPHEVHINRVSLYNLGGQLVNLWEKGLSESDITLSINGKQGMYIVRLETDKGSITKKVIVNK